MAQKEVYTAKSGLHRGTGTGSPEAFELVSGIQGIGLPSPTSQEIDTTDLQSDAKESLLGLPDYGEVSFSGKFMPSESIQQQLIADQLARDLHNWRIELSDGTTCEFAATVKGFDYTGNVDDIFKWTITLRVSGAPTWTYAGA